MKASTRLLWTAAGVGASVWLTQKQIARNREETLTGEVVLITGGSRGLGLALAREFARNGCQIAICARDRDELNRAVDNLRSGGVKASGFSCDVSNPRDVESLSAAVTDRFGRIDILVNNAGIIQVGPVQNMRAAAYEEAMNAIFWGTVYPTQAVLPAFLSRNQGRIVNICSIGGKVSVPHLSPYSSAKFAVSGFSQGLAAELRPQGIRVTTIYPGLMRTGSFVQADFSGDAKKESRWFTLGATLPFISIEAQRAARQIVEAVKRGDSERTLTVPAQILSIVNKLAPGVMSHVLSAANTFVLPDAVEGTTTLLKGRNFWPEENPMLRRLESLGATAMREFNEES